MVHNEGSGLFNRDHVPESSADKVSLSFLIGRCRLSKSSLEFLSASTGCQEPIHNMPTYQYRCTACDDQFELRQSFSDDPITSCPNERCGGEVKKVFGSVGIAFKGSGFYKNDSRSGGTKSSESSGSSESTKESGTSSDSKSSSSGSADKSSGSADKSSSSNTSKTTKD